MAYSLTFHDAVDHLLALAGGNVAVNLDSRVMRAIESAYREITEIRNWTYLYKVDQIITDEPYSTGTLAYTASTRTVTLTGGTFPTWAKYGWLSGLTGTTLCPVESRASSTSLVLDANFAPADDDTADSYVLYRTEYPLDADFQALSDILDPDGFWWQCYLTHGSWLMLTDLYQGSSAPLAWTIGQSRQAAEMYGLSAFIYPPPDSAHKLRYLYKRRARPLKVTGRQAADYTGTVAASTTAITGTGTAFHAGHVGSILRVAPAGAKGPPTGMFGDVPFEYEARIKAVGSATGITLEESLATFSGRKFRISDPVDINPSLQELFFRAIECEWIVLTEPKEVQLREQLKSVAYDRACDRDATEFNRRFVGQPGFVVDRMSTWPNAVS